MIQRSFGVAALGFIAVLGFTAAAVAAPPPASAAEPAARPPVMVEYRVLKMAAESLGALDLVRPEAGQLAITPLSVSGQVLDPDIAALQDAGHARILSRPMIMVQQGERAEIETSGTKTHLRLATRVEAQGDGFTADLVLELSETAEEPVAIQRDAITLPASLVRCPEEGECLVVLVHARAQAP